MSRRVLGAYALLAGLSLDDSRNCYRELNQRTNVDALEVPLGDLIAENPALGDYGANGLPAALGDSLDVVVTCIPTVMGKIGQDPTYGLASSDRAGREAALADCAQVLEVADRAAQGSGRPRIFAVQIHSAPRPDFHSPDAFAQSLEYLLERADSSVLLTVEHSDATRPSQDVSKGFLELSQEIEIVQQFDSKQLGITINWGRSMIEGRTAQYVNDHISQAKEAGLLKGLMFSGVTDRSGPWGPGWQDGHMAPRGEHPILSFSHASLLGEQEIETALAAAGPAADRAYTGVKVTVLEGQDSVDARFQVAQATWDIVDKYL